MTIFLWRWQLLDHFGFSRQQDSKITTPQQLDGNFDQNTVIMLINLVYLINTWFWWTKIKARFYCCAIWNFSLCVRYSTAVIASCKMLLFCAMIGLLCPAVQCWFKPIKMCFFSVSMYTIFLFFWVTLLYTTLPIRVTSFCRRKRLFHVAKRYVWCGYFIIIITYIFNHSC